MCYLCRLVAYATNDCTVRLGLTSHAVSQRAVFSPGIFFLGGGRNPPIKNWQSPQTAAKLCALKKFSARQWYLGNSLLMDNKHRKLFAIKQSKGCKFMPKMHQNTFGGRAPPGPAGQSLCAPPILHHLAAIKGPTSKADKRDGGEETAKEGKGIPSPPKSRWV